MKCVLTLLGAVTATNQMFQFQPQAVRNTWSLNSGVGASQPDMHAAIVPTPGWSVQMMASDTAVSGATDSGIASIAAVFGVAALGGLVAGRRAFARASPARAATTAAPKALRVAAPSRGAMQPRARPLYMMAETKEAEKTEEKTEEATKEEEPKVIYSEALPFLVRRQSLGPVGALVGDVGFDPLGFTEILPIEWLREAEIKHARVSMLAFVGFVFTDFYHLPGFDYTTLEAHDACIASGAMSQLLLWLGGLEVISAIGIDQMLRGSGREPGDFGFDPLGFASDPEKKADLQMKELANGRLAMFAFGGIVTQSVLTGNTFPYLF